MSAVPELRRQPYPVSKPPRFWRLRCLLLARRVASMRLVYAQLEGDFFATLLAIPRIPDECIEPLDPTTRAQMMTAFRRWMNHSHPECRDRLDCTGSVDWDLALDKLSQRHSGYQYVWKSRTYTGPGC